MRRMTEEQRKRAGSFYYKILSCVLLVVLMTVISILIISLVSMKKSATKEYRTLVQTSVSNIDKSFSQYYKNCDRYTVGLYSSVYGVKSRMEENYSPAHISKYVEEIKGAFSVIPFAQSFTLINAQNEVVFTVSNSINGKYLTSSFKGDIITHLDAQPYAQSAFLWETDNYTSPDTIKLLSVYYREMLPSSDFYNGTAVLNVDTETFSNTLFLNTDKEGVQFYIINSEGQVVAHTNTSMCGLNLSELSYVQNILGNESRFQNVKIEGKSFEIYSAPSSLPGYYIVAQTKRISFLTRYSESFTLLLILTTVITIGAIVALYFLIYRAFRPLNRVMTKIKTSDIAQNLNLSQNDIDILDQYHNEVLSNIDQLKRKNIKAEIVKKLLGGHNIDGSLIEHNFIHENGGYYLLLFYLDFDDKFFRLSDDLDDLQDQLEKMLKSIFPENLDINCLTTEPGKFIALVAWSSDNEQPIREELYNGLDNVNMIIHDEMHFRVVTYISHEINEDIGMSTCLNAYHSAVGCVRTHLCLEPEENLLIIDDDEKDEKWKSIFSEVMVAAAERHDNRLLNQKVDEAINILLCFDWDSYIDKGTELSMGIIQNSSYDIVQDDECKDIIRERLITVTGREDLFKWLVQLHSEKPTWREKDREICSPPIIERVTKYIETNYMDKDINLSFIAKEMNISSAYLGKLFRDNNGSSLNSYLMNVRLEKAKELLMSETDLSINDVSEKVGFSNSTYFITSFKKQYGITPAKFKDYQFWKDQDDRR